MRIRWTPAAATDLQRINEYLKDHHPHYRQPTLRKLYEVIGSLKASPTGDGPDASTELEKFCFRPCPMSLSIA